jgi:hypothetical protein
MPKQGGRIAQLRLQYRWDYLKQLLADSEEPAYYEATARAFLGEALSSSAEKNPVLEELHRIHWGH